MQYLKQFTRIAAVCLLALGPDNFLAPALALTAVLLMAIQTAGSRKEAARVMVR